ncbi:MAG: hypothetical protein ACOVNU_00395 [Candidatus Kapaibacteriota bacterium]
MLNKINKIITDGLEPLMKLNIILAWFITILFMIALIIILIGWTGFLIGSIISKPIQWLYKKIYF